MSNQATFLEVRSFVAEETPPVRQFETPAAASSPFLSLYEAESGGGVVDPRAEQYAVLLNELYDEEFEDTLHALVSEAAALHEARFAQERSDTRANGYEAERLLEQHFAPLVSEAHAMLDSLAMELRRSDMANLTDEEIDRVVERYNPSADLSPNFEDFFGKLKKVVKKVAGKAVALAKKGISLASKLGLGPILEKLKALVQPLLKRVIQTAIGKLPVALQPVARKLAERLPFLKELEEGEGAALGHAESCEVAEIQLEFDRQIADLLFASGEAEQELQLAEALAQAQAPEAYPVAELDRAREEFIERLGGLREGEDPKPHIQEFIPAILPALKLGISIVGRKRVVDFLAGLVAKLVQKFIGPQYAPALSQAMVDAGLRLIALEASGEDESRAAASAVAATVEETVRRVSALPEYVLDNQELLEGFALEAFEQAAASNLPQVLPEDTYRKRPDLAEARRLRGVWVPMPRGRRKRYKKFSRRIPVRIVPHSVSPVESFEGVPLSEFLEEELGVAPGEEVEAFMHLYETIPGTQLPQLARMESHIPGLGAAGGHEQLHPLTREAAGLLLGEPELGRDVQAADPHAAATGQRLYYLEIPGRKPLGTTAAPGGGERRRPTQLRLVLDFTKDEIRIHFFLSEIRAQQVAVRLRQQGHVGSVVAHLRRYVERGLRNALSGAFGRLKIVHEAVTPDQWLGALRRLPSFVPQILLGRLQEWLLKALAENLKQNAALFIKAAEDTTDGVTVVVTIANPPGFAQLRTALKGKGISLAALRMPGDAPKVSVEFAAGYVRD